MQKFLTLLIVVALLVAAGLFYAAPIISFHDIRSASQSQDIQSLSRLIDFDKLRASIRSQIEAGDAGVSAPPPSDPVGATSDFLKKAANSVGKVVTEIFDPTSKTPPKPIVDPESYLKPAALLALTYGYGKEANTATIEPGLKAPSPKMAFFSLDHARMTVADESHGTTTFTFERTGIYRWKLVHVGFPGTAIEVEGDEASSGAPKSLAE